MTLKQRQADYRAVVEAGRAGLAPDEYWMIADPENLWPETASKDLTVPVRMFCEALDCDWDEAKESGYFLTRARLPERTAH